MQIILNNWPTDKLKFLLNAVFGRATLCPPSFMSFASKSWPIFFASVQRFRDFSCLELPGGKLEFVYMQMTLQPFSRTFALSSEFLIVSPFMKKVNRLKTEAMWLGTWRHRTDESSGLTWVRKSKLLGVVFGTVPCEIDNWQSAKINKLEKSLNLWRSLSLSFQGRLPG